MKIANYKSSNILSVITLFGILLLHYILLHLTKFRDWSDMILHPWLLSQGLELYKTNIFNYTPGEPIILKLLFSITGYSIEALSTIAYFFIFLTDILLFFISNKIFKNLFHTLIVLLYYIFWHILFEGNSIWFETIFLPIILVSYLFFRNYIDTEKIINLFYSGSFFGISLLIKQTVIWPIFATLIYLLITEYSNFKKVILTSIFFITPIIILYTFSLAYFTYMGVATEYLFWSIIYTLRYSKLTNYYYINPSLSQIIYVAPVLFGIYECILLLIYKVNKKIYSNQLLYLIILTIFLLMSPFPRFGLLKLIPVLPFAAIATGYIFKFHNHCHKNIKISIIYYGIAIFCLLGLIRSSIRYYIVEEKKVNSFFNNPYLKMAATVKSTIGNKNFFILGNYDYLYFTLNYKPIVFPFVFQAPWILEVPNIQKSIINSLELRKPTFVLYFPFHKAKQFYSDYIPINLMKYIQANYKIYKRLPGFGWILIRNINLQ